MRVILKPGAGPVIPYRMSLLDNDARLGHRMEPEGRHAVGIQNPVN
jgi:hypothetical protein